MNVHFKIGFARGVSVLSMPVEQSAPIKRPVDSVRRAWTSVGRSLDQAISKESLNHGKKYKRKYPTTHTK